MGRHKIKIAYTYIAGLILLATPATIAQSDVELRCSMLNGCHIGHCDPVPSGWAKPEHDLSVQLDREEFPIICKGAGVSSDVSAINKVMEEIGIIKLEMDLLKTKNAKLEAGNEVLQREMDLLKTKNAKLEVENKVLQREMDLLKTKNTKLEIENKVLQRDIKRLESLYNKQDKKRNSSKSEIHRELTTNPNHNDCSTIDTNDVALHKSATGGVFTINPGGTGQLNVYCDLTTDGGKWTVFQRRQDGRVDFVSRNWADYVNGFGNPANEYWLGLEKLHQMTANGKFELRIDLEDWEGNKRYAEYKNFHIESAATKYQLNIGSYQGDAGDSLTYHNGMKFTTFDQDNDAHSSVNCASHYNSGGWWFQHCFNTALNGKYNNQGPISEFGKGIMWKDWKGWYYSLKSTEMKFRPMV